MSSVWLVTRVHTLDGSPLPEGCALHAELSEVYESEYTRP